MQPLPSRRRRRSSRGSRRRKLVAVGLLALLLLGAAGIWRLHRISSPAELLERGLARSAHGDLRGALLDLKAVVAAEPGRAAARFELGKVELGLGDAVSAFKEFESARNLGLDTDALKQALVSAAIAGGKLERAAVDLALYAVPNQAGWELLKGELALAGGRYPEARADFEAALKLEPGRTDAQRALVRAELALGEKEGARRTVEQALAASTADPGLWFLKGQLEFADQHYAPAIEAYRHALDLAPQDAQARFGLATAQIALKDFSAAGKTLDGFGQIAYEDPRLLYARALIANGQDQPRAALSAVKKALQSAPHSRENLLLAADLHFRLGDYSAAADCARRLLEIDPKDAVALRLQQAAALASGKLESALGILQGTDPERLTDPQLLSLLGTTYLKNGQYAAGAKTLGRANALAPDSSPIRLQFALGKLATGESAEALKLLEELRTADPDYLLAEVALVLVELDSAGADAAGAAIRRALAAHPDEPVLLNTRGFVEERSGDLAAARRTYESVLASKPDFLPARFNLARLDGAAGAKDAAKARYREVLERHPHHPDALGGLAALAMQAGDETEAERLWQEAREHNPEAVLPRVMLAQQARVHHKPELAAQLAEEASALAPFLPLVQYEFALAMLANNHPDRAVEPLHELVQRFPKAIPLKRLLASAYARTGATAPLEQTLRGLLELAPEDLDATRALAEVALGKRDFPTVERLAATLEAGAPATAAELRGDAATADGRIDAAQTAYERAQAAAPSARLLAKLQLVNDQRATKAELYPAWIAAHPDDLATRLAAGTRWQRLGRADLAREQYEWVVKAAPGNALALNNLAWLLFEAGDARGVELARRAVDAAPERAEYLDTYGWILFKQGSSEQALGLLRKAVELAPAQPDLHFHLAAVLAKGGQRAAARTELETLLAKPDPFASRREAEALQRDLAGD